MLEQLNNGQIAREKQLAQQKLRKDFERALREALDELEDEDDPPPEHRQS